MALLPGDSAPAFRWHRLDAIRQMLGAGLDRSWRDADGNTCLHLACHPLADWGRDSLKAVAETADAANVNAVNAAGWSPLLQASILLPAEAVELLLSRGADPARRDPGGRTALTLAALYGRSEITLLLLPVTPSNQAHCEEGGAPAYPAHPRIAADELTAIHLRHLEMFDKLAGRFPALDKAVAGSDSASERVLQILAGGGDKATRRCVALNPRTPTPALLALASEFPRQVYRNPIFDWLLIENPALLSEMGRGALKRMLRQPDCPTTLLNWASEHGTEAEQLAAARHPLASAEILRSIASKGAVQVSRFSTRLNRAAATAIALDLQSTTDQLGEICGKDEVIDRMLARHPNATADLLDRLARGGDVLVWEAVKQHPNTSARTLQFLSPSGFRTHRLRGDRRQPRTSP